jgi:hypothetical protein
MEEIYTLVIGNSVSSNVLDSCKYLETKHFSIFLKNEHTWQLKIRVIWLEAEDQNKNKNKNVGKITTLFGN